MVGPPRIRLLGELLVTGSAGAVPLPASKKTRALLAYLAGTGRAHTREDLCDLLWQGPDDPRAALRWSLTKLRAALGAEILRADRERVELGPVVTDLALVQTETKNGVDVASIESLSASASLFRGEFLHGLALPDCYRFHEWCAAKREVVRELQAAILMALVDRLRSSPDEALRHAREHVAVDPLSEKAHANVVNLLADQGRKAEAMAQYERCCLIWEREFGRRPGALLLEAKMRIGSDASRPVVPAETRESRETSSPSELVPLGDLLVGRDDELGVIARVVADSAHGEGGSVLLVTGEPGIGKSRLLAETARRVEAGGGIALSGRAFEAEMVRPYGPFIDALRGVDEARVPAPLRSALGELLPRAHVESSTARDRATFFDAVLRLLLHLASTARPIALLIDDLQWVDEASAALLHCVARSRDQTGVLVACGVRSGELADNPAALGLYRALARSGHATLLPLGPLATASVASLVRSVGPTLDAERVARESEGNPLFAIELSRARLRHDGAAWDSLGGLIDERLERLSDAALEVLEWAAALGQGFDLQILERSSGAPPQQLLAALRDLERHGILRVSADGAGYDFAHDLLRTGAYRKLSTPRRRFVHAHIARAMHALGASDGVLAGDIAHHAALGSEFEMAADAALVGAHRSLRIFAGAEAARLADAGLHYSTKLPRERRISLQIAFLEVHVRSGTWTDRERNLRDELTRVVMEAQDAALHSEAVSGLTAISVLQFDTGDLSGAHESTLQAVDASRESDPISRAIQLALAARCLAMLERDIDQAAALYREARALSVGAERPVVAIEWAGGLLDAFEGDANSAVQALSRALSLARADEDHWTEYECLRQLVQITLETEDRRSAAALCTELVDVAAKMGEGSELPAAKALFALTLMLDGEADAEGRFEDAVEALRVVDAKGMLAYVLAFAAERDADVGRFGLAENRAAEALGAARVANRRSQMALARVVLGRVALARGDEDVARSEVAHLEPDLNRPMGLSARARIQVALLKKRTVALDR